MIHLVLDAHGQQAAGYHLKGFAVAVKSAHLDMLRPLHRFVKARHTQAAFFIPQQAESRVSMRGLINTRGWSLFSDTSITMICSWIFTWVAVKATPGRRTWFQACHRRFGARGHPPGQPVLLWCAAWGRETLVWVIVPLAFVTNVW